MGTVALTLVLLRLADLPRRLRKILLLDIFPAGRRKVRGHFYASGKERRTRTGHPE
jgi:hypothetical protein